MSSWSVLGRLFGYPECCIAEFVELAHLDDPDSHKRPLIGTGFVPCKLCGETKTAEELTDEINTIRLYHEPFPTDVQDWDGIKASFQMMLLKEEDNGEAHSLEVRTR